MDTPKEGVLEMEGERVEEGQGEEDTEDLTLGDGKEVKVGGATVPLPTPPPVLVGVTV